VSKKIDYSVFKFGKPEIEKQPRETTSQETYNLVDRLCDYKCVFCDNPERHLHHIHGRGKNLTDNPLNCIMLCDKHHKMVHGNGKKWRPILDKKRLELEGNK
jgi:hypothetical protein